MPTASELAIDTSASAGAMAEAIFGNGVKVVSASYTGDGDASGLYSGATTTMPGVAPSDTGVILSTGRAESITNASGAVNQSASTTADTQGIDNDAALNQVAGFKTYDAAILEVQFIPQGDVLTMQIVFSSEEYLEYCGSGFNDAVGIWVNGQPAEMTVGDGEVSINNINNVSNSDLYIDNKAGGYNTEMDGFTVTLSLKAPVTAGTVNTIRIGIADAGDAAYDSNLLIAGNSVQCAVIAADDAIDVGIGKQAELDVLANDSTSGGGSLTITHINGQPVSAGDTVMLANGVGLTLTADGTIAILGDDVASQATFAYTVSDGAGNSDIGYAAVNTVPCFVAGTRVETALGPRPVETIRPGDLVLTRDHGYQPVRWAGQTRHDTTPDTAPVIIGANALGAHGPMLVSPQHRVLLGSARTELLFAAPEVLVSALHLVGLPRVTRGKAGRPLVYVHLLFDRHEVICANALWSESYLPGPQTMPGFSAAVQAEILTLFPGLDPATGKGYGPAARLCLRRYEAQALVTCWPSPANSMICPMPVSMPR